MPEQQIVTCPHCRYAAWMSADTKKLVCPKCSEVIAVNETQEATKGAAAKGGKRK